MSRFSVWVHDHFGQPTETDATAVFTRYAGDAAEELIDYAKRTIAAFDLTTIATGDRQQITTALVTAAAKGLSVNIPTSVVSWLVAQYVAQARSHAGAKVLPSTPALP